MSAREAYVAAILDESIEELQERSEATTPQAQLQLIRSWIEQYESDPPKNRLEMKILDALEIVATKLILDNNLQLNYS